MDPAKLDEESLQQLYAWIDEIPLSRPKKNITRDFSDGVMVAEMVNYFIPKLADLHNYAPANAVQQKAENWKVLNRKLFTKLNYSVPDAVITGISNCKPGMIEVVLYNLRKKIEVFIARRKAQELREKNQVYDEINEQYYLGPVEGGGVYSYSEGPPYPPQFGNSSAEHQHLAGYGNFSGFNNHAVPKVNGSPLEQPKVMAHVNQHMPRSQLHHPMRTYPKDQSRQMPYSIQQQLSPSSSPNYASAATISKDSKKERDDKGPPPPGRSHSLQDMSEVAGLRISLAEKEQALLASQETVQILQVKIRRLEHLLHLKDLRLDDMNRRLSSAEGVAQRQIQGGMTQRVSPQQHGTNFKPHPPLPGIRRDSYRSDKGAVPHR